MLEAKNFSIEQWSAFFTERNMRLIAIGMLESQKAMIRFAFTHHYAIKNYSETIHTVIVVRCRGKQIQFVHHTWSGEVGEHISNISKDMQQFFMTFPAYRLRLVTGLYEITSSRFL